MPTLSSVQALALDDETRTAADVITAGVHELRRLDESNDRVCAPMLLLSVGFERLLKLTVVSYELARFGTWPSSKAVRRHGGRTGHDLVALTSAVVSRVAQTNNSWGDKRAETTFGSWPRMRCGVDYHTSDGQDRGLHELRRSFATALRQAGGSIEETARLGRWSSPRVLLESYSGTEDEWLHGAVDRLGDSFGG